MSRSFLPNSSIKVFFCVAGFRPGGRGPFVSAKGPKTIDAPSGLIRLDGRKAGEGEPTRYAQTRLAGSSERPPRGPGGRRRALRDQHFMDPDDRARNHTFRMIRKMERDGFIFDLAFISPPSTLLRSSWHTRRSVSMVVDKINNPVHPTKFRRKHMGKKWVTIEWD